MNNFDSKIIYNPSLVFLNPRKAKAMSKPMPLNQNNNQSNFITPTSSNLQAYYLKKQPSFGRLKIEHLQNGAYVDEAKNVFFKLFTFDDVKHVFVEIQDKALYELEKVETGIFKKKMAPENVSIGDKYRFLIERENGEIVYCKDPYAMKRNSVWNDFSEIYSHHKFKWNDKDWIENKIAQKVSRRSATNDLLPVNSLKISEVNIATLTKEGDFKAAKSYIDKISKDGFFNTIEIMPVENTYSFNWGYDGVDKFAVQESVLGGPDALKEFIDYAHSKKINIIMDVVPNHLGTDGNTLEKVAPYINTYANGPFGAEFNLEGDPAHNKYVRDYLANMCLNWLENYHCDGLRLDMTKFMHSDYTMKHISMEVHYHHPDAVLIAEDGRENLLKVTQPLTNVENATGKNENEHAEIMKLVDKNEISLDNLGYDSEWDFPFFHKLYDSIFNVNAIKSLNETIKNTFNRIKYPMSHDEIGNLDGTRLISKIINGKIGMLNKIEGDHLTEKSQRAAHATQSILESKVSGEYDKFSPKERLDFLKAHYVAQDITPQEIEEALYNAISEHKVALGNTFATPGPKMVFQGDEEGALNYFKFFRQFSPIKAAEDSIALSNKGYKSGFDAFKDSKMDSINYSPEYTKTMDEIKDFTKNISELSEKIPALKSGKIMPTSIVNEDSRVQGIHLKEDESEVFSISNFSSFSYDKDYKIQFPKGRWKEILNSNDTKYAGDDKFKNGSSIINDGEKESSISLPANSLLIFKKVI